MMSASALAMTRVRETQREPTVRSASAQFVNGHKRGAVGNLPLFLQPKLAISQPGDPYEQEADRVADQVMRMPVPTVQRQCAVCATDGPLCSACEEGSLQVSRKAEGESAGDVPSSVHSALSSPGQPLAASTRAFFEPRFGQDLGHVRVHTDREAQQSARVRGD